jgi:hypothetical protein
MKTGLSALVLLAAAALAFAQEPTAAEIEKKVKQEQQLAEKQAQMELKHVEEIQRAEEMKARLQELQGKLLQEKIGLEEQARLAKEFARQALELQKSWNHSPERQAELAKMQFDLQKELSLAGLYNDRMMDLLDKEDLERNKQILSLEAKCVDLSRLYRESKEADKQKKIEQELDQVVKQLFDLRETQREKDIASMEKDLAEMKTKLENRRAQKNQIIKKRMDQLLGNKDDLEW